jgi:hypothetical protein
LAMPSNSVSFSFSFKAVTACSKIVLIRISL